MTRDRISRDWGKPLVKDYTCNQHPKPPAGLVKLLATYTNTTAEQTRHMLDRLRHITLCCREPEALTLRRLQPGTAQPVKPPVKYDAKGEPI